MTTYATVLNPSLTNQEGHNKYLNRVFTDGVAMGSSANSLLATQRGAGANMSVDIAVGDAHISIATKLYSYWVWTDAVTNVTVAAADPTNGRVDVLVGWVDTTVTTTATANSPGALKFSLIAGTPSATPTAVTDTAIQTALGASVGWVKLAYVFVGAGVTSITTANVTDARVALTHRVKLNANTFDYSTVQAQPTAMPIKSSLSNLMGFSTTADLYRVGNIVLCLMNCTTTSMSSGDGLALTETIPAGYRPATGTAGILVSSMTAGGINTRVGWTIAPTGSMTIGNAVGISSNTRLMGSAMWITDNTWPA